METIFGEADTDGTKPSCAAHFLLGCVLCNDAQSEEEGMGDPTELALLHMAQNSGVSVTRLRERFPRINEIGFDSERKMMTTLHRMGSGQTAYTKGRGGADSGKLWKLF